MSRLIRFYIRTALGCLVASALFSAAILAAQGLGAGAGVAAFLPGFYHLLMVGWATQLICGVALWMFPPLTRERPRGDERIGWGAYVALNGGLLLRVIAEPLHTWAPQPTSGAALALSGVLQAAAIWALALLLWPRVKGRPERRPAERGGS
jgi:hypothetical protein